MIKFNDKSCSTTSSMSNLGVSNNNSNNITPTKKKYRKKPDPSAPKITRPCTECGKKFWSWKALFGHMRCHPERQWRGINPPQNFSNHHHKENSSSVVAVASTSGSSYSLEKMSEDDHDAALSLLMLANGFGSKTCSDHPPSITTSEKVVSPREGVVVISGPSVGGGDGEVVWGSGDGNSCRYECSSCKKVFGSHQALGGHRASHKNVKGCFANTRINDEVVMGDEFSSGNLQNSDNGSIVVEDENDKMLTMGLSLGLNSGTILSINSHRCNICFKAFSSGQALGGHKRCHWEKFDDGNNNECSEVDLNFPAAALPPRIVEGNNSYCHHSWSLGAMDLRLGL